MTKARPSSKRKSKRFVRTSLPGVPRKTKQVLRLFIAGATTRSLEAVLRCRALCDSLPKGSFRMEVIDIYQQPALARANQIVATPTLIKELPRPTSRFIGSLTDLTHLFVAPSERARRKSSS